MMKNLCSVDFVSVILFYAVKFFLCYLCKIYLELMSVHMNIHIDRSKISVDEISKNKNNCFIRVLKNLVDYFCVYEIEVI